MNKTNNLALEINHLDTTFAKFSLKKINLNLERGVIMGLIGENGAGKTTLIKSIMNMYYSANGRIRVYGYDHVEDEVTVKNLIGYVAAEDFLVPTYTLKFLANHFRILYDNWNDELFNEYVNRFNLPLNDIFRNYSTGMKKKAMLVLALSHEPKLLLLDEPTAGLDPLVKTEILDILRDFVEDGEKSVLFSTHSTNDLDKIADYITLISDGAVLESDAMDNISDKYLIVSGNSSAIEIYSNIMVGMIEKNGFTEALIPRGCADKLSKDHLVLKQPTIEDLMIHLIKHNAEKNNDRNIF